MTASRILLYFCLSFIGGIFLNSVFEIPLVLVLAILILAIFLISIFWSCKKAVIIGFSILFLVFGIWRHQLAEIQISKSKLQIYNDKEEIITLIGIVSSQPDFREKSQKLIIETEKLNDFNVKEKILITTNRYPEYRYGDKLKIIGKSKTPPVFEGFNYKDYLKKDKIYSVMNWPEIELIGSGFDNPLMKILFSFKKKFKETARTFISPPQEGILEALVFGDEENISKQWKEKLNFTGTRHITAVSGMNITIIAFLIISFGLSIGLQRRQALFLTIFLLILYILMIGAPSSAVRAGIMGGLLIIAQYFGRLSLAQRAVIFAATFMLILNPLLLKSDIGFQLSFLAILGMIYLQPFFFSLFQKIPDFKFFQIKTTLSATLAAQIFTLPILVYNFGYIPLVSPITNILIVPLLAPLTVLIFIFAISGMIFSVLGWILSWPIWLVLSYIVNVIDWFSKLPFLSLTFENLSWIWLLIIYLILGFITWRIQESQKLKFLNY